MMEIVPHGRQDVLEWRPSTDGWLQSGFGVGQADMAGVMRTRWRRDGSEGDLGYIGEGRNGSEGSFDSPMDGGQSPRDLAQGATKKEPAAAATRGVAYVIGTYPLLTTTFIDREIAMLRELGADVVVVSLRRPHGQLSPEQTEESRQVRYVLPVSPLALVLAQLRFGFTRPLVYFRTLSYLLTRPHPTVKARLRTILHFGEGVQVADILRQSPRNIPIHAHFVDRAATAALVAGRLLGRPYSVTAHANDIYVDPVMLPEKIAEARFVATCTAYNAAHLAGIAPDAAASVTCIHHGLDVDRYVPNNESFTYRPAILAVGQLREKKGFTYLVAACAELRKRGHEFVCDIVGEGPLRQELEAQIRESQLEDTVSLRGALDHQSVIDHYRTASVFTLPCVTAANGDRDGIPNVILEAMAMDLPVVSTRHSGIPEAVDDGISGVLVPQRDAAALADAIERLLCDSGLRRRMGRAGRHIVVSRFDVATNVKLLMSRLGV
jgi:glycosyltransferase involved in cell wall biosynthesis